MKRHRAASIEPSAPPRPQSVPSGHRNGRHRAYHCLSMFVLVLPLAAGCGGGGTASAGSGRQPDPAAQTTPAASQARTPVSALETLLAAYASADPPAWAAFDDVDGVTWGDAAATLDPDAKPEHAWSRGGRLVLAGFGETSLPNGKVGVEAGSVRGDEGRSGVTLNGNAGEVTSIAVMKFYPDDDYERVLRAQIGRGGRVREIAAECRLAEGTMTNAPNFARNEFFELTLSGGQRIYAEGTVDEEGSKYSPGSTTYFFYRKAPTDRIDAMQCREATEGGS